MCNAEKILCVDDEPTVLRALARVLKGHGFEVHTADGTASALSLAAQNEYVLVATDYAMPETNGLGLIEQMKRVLPWASYLVVSGQCDLEVAAEAINDYGIDGLINKPWHSSHLLSMVQRGIEAHWERIARRQLEQSAVRNAEAMEAQRRALSAAARQSRHAMAEALLSALEFRAHETHAHCRRVAEYSQIIAERLLIEPSAADGLREGAVLHDVGKIGVPDAILCKPGPLDAEEMRVMQQHPSIGARILEGAGCLPDTRQIVLQHHERWDGRGYPHGLVADAIRIEARILSVADALDAILSDRPYRPASPFSVALDLILAGSGTQFDPRVVQAFLEIEPERWAHVQASHPDCQH